MTLVAPPPVMDCARVLAYAHVDPVLPFLARTSLYVDGTLLGRVPALAICQNLSPDGALHLLHCDENWNVLGASGGRTVEETMQVAEQNYPGLAKDWVHLNTAVETAMAYYDEHCGGRCSFCGKRDYEVTAMVTSESASICRECVELFYREFTHP